MELRDAKVADAAEIASVARASLTASYGDFVDESTIEQAVEEWYAEDEVSRLLGDENAVFEVAEVEGEVAAFVQGAIVEADPMRGELYWLHVVPDARGRGIGPQLLGHAQDEFEDRGAAVIRGYVLADHEAGAAFYEDHGFEQTGTDEAHIGGETFEELIFEHAIGDRPEQQVLEPVEGPDGRELVVNYSEPERGIKAPFYPAFSSRELTDKYGWFCGECESLDNAMDSMGRVVCNECGNERKATRWDASYL